MGKLTDKQIDKGIAKLFKEEPVKMLTLMILRAGKECVAANAETLDLSTEATIDNKRYKVQVDVKITEINP